MQYLMANIRVSFVLVMLVLTGCTTSPVSPPIPNKPNTSRTIANPNTQPLSPALRSQRIVFQTLLKDTKVQVKQSEQGIRLIFPGDTSFAKNSVNVTPTTQTLLANVAKSLESLADMQIIVQGHTDSAGTELYNQSLSERRAEAVKTVLVDKQIPAAKIVTVGMGEYQPISSDPSEKGMRANRRIEVIFTPAAKSSR